MSAICVIGGGPAGSTFAARMAQLGHKVCVIERESFPRRHLGESLSPGVLPLMDAIGARAAIEAAGFTPVRRVHVNWAEGPQVREDPRAEGLLVDRGVFDQLLLDHAKALGVHVFQPATVRERVREPGGWRLRVEAHGTESEIHAAFIADAGGRSGGICGSRRRTGCRTLALYAYWRGDGLPTEPRIEAGADAWYWGVPLPDGSYNTLVFVDVEHFRSLVRGSALRTGPEDADAEATHDHALLTARFLQLVERSSLVEDCRHAHLAAPVLAIDATPYIDDECVTGTSIKVGDAALALDPISSSGVQKAIQSALAAAAVANTLLRKPASREAALRFYRQNLADASARHCRWAASHYDSVAAQSAGSFWRERASGAEPPPATPRPNAELDTAALAAKRVELSPSVQFVDVPCIEGDFVTVKAALRHPALESPVAYLGGWELAPLLEHLPPGATPMQIARWWSARVPMSSGLQIMAWLLNNEILVGDSRSAQHPRR